MSAKNQRTDNEDCWATMGLADGAPTSDRQLVSDMDTLTQTIEGEIIPRLLVMFDGAIETARVSVSADSLSSAPPFTGNVEEFVDLLLNQAIDVSTKYVTTLIDRGASLKNIYLDLLAPSARHLGLMWEEDYCNFTQVTVGVARMHQLLHMFSPCFCAHHADEPGGARTALIVPMPGEQHTFGHLMVVEFFRREGWNVWSGAPGTESEVVDIVSQQHFDLVGISIASDVFLDKLRGLLQNIRKTSVFDDVKILVGGRAFSDSDLDPKDYGADGSAVDGEHAVQIASRLA